MLLGDYQKPKSLQKSFKKLVMQEFFVTEVAILVCFSRRNNNEYKQLIKITFIQPLSSHRDWKSGLYLLEK